jgi:uncharacterized protein (TIGR02145 family)
VTASIAVHPAISAGAITSAATTTKAGTDPNVTTTNTTAASGGSGNLAYEWRRSGSSNKTFKSSNAVTYALGSDATNYSTVGTYYFNRYVKDATCPNIAAVAAVGTYTLYVEATGTVQPDGNCSYTEPAVVGTFANFVPGNYTSSTSLSLTDERDNKIYPVVKINNRWIMARNLNYQEGLTWQGESKNPTTTSGGTVTALIGNFWCPGGNNSSSATSTRASCDVWGALYSWETAMSFDSVGSWVESETYNTGAANAENSKFNHGRTARGSGTGGRGICPPNWHVPTDNEWGIILDGMEDGSSTAHQNAAAGNSWSGTAAGKRAKSTCTTSSANTAGDVSDTYARWYYCGTQGTDEFGLRVLPSGSRYNSGSVLQSRGLAANFWASSATGVEYAWSPRFIACEGRVARDYSVRSNGYSVRCIRDL